jgi:hypothetical protein
MVISNESNIAQRTVNHFTGTGRLDSSHAEQSLQFAMLHSLRIDLFMFCCGRLDFGQPRLQTCHSFAIQRLSDKKGFPAESRQLTSENENRTEMTCDNYQTDFNTNEGESDRV